MPYTIYHVVGIKVGATTDFERRSVQNREEFGESIQIEIIETLDDSLSVEEVGSREWYWAEHFGYRKGWPYSAGFANASPELQSNLARRSFLVNASSEQQAEFGKRGGQRCVELRKVFGGTIDAAEAGRRGGSSPNHPINQGSICPHCGKAGKNHLSMVRWHFDNCKLKSSYLIRDSHQDQASTP